LRVTKFKFEDIVTGKEGLLKGPFGSDLKKSLYVPKAKNTYKVYLQENILKQDKSKGKHYITDTYFNDKMKRYEVSEGDFIVTCDGTLGRIYQLNNIKEKGIISSSLLRITLNKELVDENFFLYHWSSNIKDPLIRSHDNSVLKHLPGVQAIRGFEIILPELENQKKIGIFLKNIDSKIELNNKINKELESMSKTLYDYWFVQFDFPDENGKPYKSSGGKMVYDQELKREVPEGWNSIVLDKIVDILNGYAFKSEDYVENGIFILRTKNFNEENNTEFLSDDVFLSNDIKEKYNSYLCQAFDYHVVMVGASVGKTGMIYSHQLPALRNQNMWCFRPKKTFSISRGYIKYFVNSIVFEFSTHATGSARQFYTKDNFKQHLVILPSSTILEKFARLHNPILEKQAIIQQENQELAKLRDWLLPMLMNGQVKVK
jgi:type I restriction enzyme S subunit